MKEVCANCRFWEIELGALEGKEKNAAQRVTRGKTDTFKATYGKCRAEYINQDGELAIYNMGTLGSMRCAAEDDKGNKLFDPVPMG